MGLETVYTFTGTHLAVSVLIFVTIQLIGLSDAYRKVSGPDSFMFRYIMFTLIGVGAGGLFFLYGGALL